MKMMKIKDTNVDVAKDDLDIALCACFFCQTFTCVNTYV